MSDRTRVECFMQGIDPHGRTAVLCSPSCNFAAAEAVFQANPGLGFSTNGWHVPGLTMGRVVKLLLRKTHKKKLHFRSQDSRAVPSVRYRVCG